MASAAEERRQQVLRAIVADYIATQEPVGSKALLDRHRFDVSSATIRNDMAALEAEGYISQQHASSGRLPTQKGYRLFVDSLSDIKPLSDAERRTILTFLEDGVNLEDVLHRSAQLLSQFTRQTAIVQLPNLRASHVKHCEVVSLTPTRLLLVLITDTGRVDQRHVELDHTCEADHIMVLRDLLNQALDGKTLADAAGSLAAITHPDPEVTSHLSRCVTVLLASIQDLDQVSVLIGDETRDDQLRCTSVVATGYGSPGAPLGGLGVVGPTYMDYSGTMSKVYAVAHYVSRVLSEMQT